MFWLKFQSLGSILVEPVIRESVTVRTRGRDELFTLWMLGGREREERKRQRKQRRRRRE